MATRKMIQVASYFNKTDLKAIAKKAGERGFISESAYLRFLALRDIGKVKGN